MDEMTSGPWERFKATPQALPTGPWDKFKQAQGTPLGPVKPLEEDPVSRFDQIMGRYKDTPLTKEIILGDEDLMGLVRENVRTRFKDRNLIAGAVTGAAGGATAYGWEDMSDEDLFETWQEYHRSFAGGQTVTTANEIAYAATADEETKARLGLGYKLFDSMDNAFVGSGTWAETFDAAGDYMQAAIWDPTTVLSLGVGRAFSAGGAKAAAFALREGAKTAFEASVASQIAKGVARPAAEVVARQAADKVLQQGFKAIGAKDLTDQVVAKTLERATKANIAAGMTAEAAKVAAQKAVASVGTRGTLDVAKQEMLRFGVASGAVDMAVSVGTDVASQNVKLLTGAQDEFSIPQTAIAALGVIVTPALAAAAKAGAKGISKVAGKNFSSYKALQQDYVGKDPVAIMEIMKSRVDLSKVNGSLRSSMKDFLDNLTNGLSWPEAKVEGRKILSKIGEVPKVTPSTNDFFTKFMFGYTDTKGKTYNGYVYELARAGFKFVPRDKEDNPTNFFGDALLWLDKDVVSNAIRGYEKASGKPLGIGYTPEELSAAYKTSTSEAGYALRLSKVLSEILKNTDDPSQIAKIVGKDEKDAEKSAYGAWVLSIWKRMVTSHPATTGLNIKGWGGLSLMNTTSDLVQGTLEYGAGTFMKIKGDQAAAAKLIQRGRGSLLGLARRGYNILDWDATMKEADAFLSYNSTVREELFRQGTGEAGSPQATLKDFNIKEGTVTSGVESIVGGAQAVTGVILQDEVTKKLSFMTALDRQILREYGQSYEEFMARPDRWLEMSTEKFQSEVIARALDRTARETASKTWSDKKGNSGALLFAKMIEGASNNQALGYAIPFGRFFNTATAVLGDFSMINAVRHATKLARGAKVDAAQDEGMELLAKGISGVATVATFGFLSMEKVENGLAWNQERREDGSTEDLTYDFPESFWRIGAQVMAHMYKDGEVPADLAEELVQVYGAQTFRAGMEGVDTVMQLFKDALGLDGAAVVEGGKGILTNFFGGIISGISRPLDPINTGAMILRDDYSQPDRRQGNVFYNESTRYIDKIFGLETEEQRNLPTKGPNLKKDMGSVLGGVRSTSENSPAESMMGSIGLPSWKVVRWDGEPEVKNRLDGIFAPIVNTYAELSLARHPDFFEKPLEERQYIFKSEVQEPAKKKAEEMLKMGGADDQITDLSRQISSEGKGKVQRVLGKLGYPSLTEVMKEEGAKEKLQTILYYLKNYEDLEF